MIRLVAVVFVLALASSAQAIQPTPIKQLDEVVIKVRQAEASHGLIVHERLGVSLPNSRAEKDV